LKKFLVALLLTCPVLSFADRLGSLSSNTQVLLSTQSSGGASVYPATATVSFPLGATISTMTVTGSNNLSFTENNGDTNLYQIVGSSANVTAGHIAVFTSSYSIVDGGAPGGGGGGTPGGSSGQLQYNNAGSFGGAKSVVTSSSMTVISSMSVTNNGAQNNISPGLLDVYAGSAFTGQPLFTVGSSNQSAQFLLEDQTYVNMNRYGSQSGHLLIGQNGSTVNHQVQDDNAATQYINLWNNGEMDLQTTTVGNGGGNIVFKPNTTTELTVSTLGVTVAGLSSGLAQIDASHNLITSNTLGVSSLTITNSGGLGVTYGVNVGSMTGAGLTSCSGGSNAVTWNSSTNQFGCNTISGGGGGGYNLQPTTVTVNANFGITVTTITVSSNTVLTGTTFYANGQAVINGVNSSTWLTANQTVTLSGDVTGTGTTAITATAAAGQSHITTLSASSITVTGPFKTNASAILNQGLQTNGGNAYGIALNNDAANSVASILNRAGTSHSSLNLETDSGVNVVTSAGSNIATFSTSTTGVILVSVSSAVAVAPTDFLLNVSSSAGTMILGVNNAGNVISSGTVPSVSSCGTSPTMDQGATNTAGTINVGSGSPTACTLTFANGGFATTPTCVVSDDLQTAEPAITSRSATAFTVTLGAALNSGHLFFICVGGRGG